MKKSPLLFAFLTVFGLGFISPVASPAFATDAAAQAPSIAAEDSTKMDALNEKAPAYLERIGALQSASLSLTTKHDPDLFHDFCVHSLDAEEGSPELAKLQIYTDRAKADENIISYTTKINTNEQRRTGEILTELYTDVGFEATSKDDFIAVMQSGLSETRAEKETDMRKMVVETGTWTRKDCTDAILPNAKTSVPFGMTGLWARLQSEMHIKGNPEYVANVKELLK